MSCPIVISTSPSLKLSTTQNNNASESEKELWQTYYYYASPKLKAAFCQEDKTEIKSDIKKTIDFFRKLFCEENHDAFGKVIYKSGTNACVTYWKDGDKETKEFSKWTFYKTFIKPSLFHILKNVFKMNNLHHYKTDFCHLDSENTPFEILNFSMSSHVQTSYEKASCDFVLQSEINDIPVNSQALMDKGGEVIRSLVHFALNNDNEDFVLHMNKYSYGIVLCYKKFVSCTQEKFLKFMDEFDVKHICELYSLAQECACFPLMHICVKLLGKKATSQDHSLLQDLISQFKDKEIETICEKFQSEDMVFELEMF